MKTSVYCRVNEKGIHTFYLLYDNDSYFLFVQDYRKGVQNYFGGSGVPLNEAMNYSKAHRDSALTKTMSKLPMYIKYIEKEYGIAVLDRTRKKKVIPSFGYAELESA